VRAPMDPFPRRDAFGDAGSREDLPASVGMRKESRCRLSFRSRFAGRAMENEERHASAMQSEKQTDNGSDHRLKTVLSCPSSAGIIRQFHEIFISRRSRKHGESLFLTSAFDRSISARVSINSINSRRRARNARTKAPAAPQNSRTSPSVKLQIADCQARLFSTGITAGDSAFR